MARRRKNQPKTNRLEMNDEVTVWSSEPNTKGDFTLEVKPACVFGSLAVVEWPTNSTYYTLVHVPTAYYVVISSYLSAEEALHMVNLLNEGYDWDFDDPKDIPFGVKAYYWNSLYEYKQSIRKETNAPKETS